MFVNFKNFKGAFTDSISLLKEHWKNLSIDFVKVAILSYIPMLLWFSVMYLINQFPEYIPSMLESFMVLILFVISLVLYYIVDSMSMNVPDEIANGKRISVIKQFLKNAFPMAKIVLIVLAIVVLFTEIAKLNPILTVILLVLGAIAIFFFQFLLYEIIVGRKGMLKSFSRSFNIVKGNISNVIIFDVVFVVISLILYFSEQMLFYSLASISGLIVTLSDISYLLMVAAFAPFVLFAVGLILIGAIISYFVYVVPMYFLWKRLTAEKEQENIKKPTTQ